MPNGKLVLIIEDNERVSLAQKEYLESEHPGIEIMVADNIDRAKECLKIYGRGLSLIILDACLQSSGPNSMPLIAESRKCGFEGPIIASSSSSFYAQPLIDAGALPTEDKSDAVKKALELLK